MSPVITRTARTPGFWEYPPSPHDYPLIHIRSQVKQVKVKVTDLKKFAKNSYFKNCVKTWHMTHLLILLNGMCKYEMDSTSIMEVTEWTQFCPQTDGSTDRRMDRRCATGIPSFNFVEAGGVKILSSRMLWIQLCQNTLIVGEIGDYLASRAVYFDLYPTKMYISIDYAITMTSHELHGILNYWQLVTFQN